MKNSNANKKRSGSGAVVLYSATFFSVEQGRKPHQCRLNTRLDGFHSPAEELNDFWRAVTETPSPEFSKLLADKYGLHFKPDYIQVSVITPIFYHNSIGLDFVGLDSSCADRPLRRLGAYWKQLCQLEYSPDNFRFFKDIFAIFDECRISGAPREDQFWFVPVFGFLVYFVNSSLYMVVPPNARFLEFFSSPYAVFCDDYPKIKDLKLTNFYVFEKIF